MALKNVDRPIIITKKNKDKPIIQIHKPKIQPQTDILDKPEIQTIIYSYASNKCKYITV